MIFGCCAVTMILLLFSSFFSFLSTSPFSFKSHSSKCVKVVLLFCLFFLSLCLTFSWFWCKFLPFFVEKWEHFSNVRSNQSFNFSTLKVFQSCQSYKLLSNSALSLFIDENWSMRKNWSENGKLRKPMLYTTTAATENGNCQLAMAVGFELKFHCRCFFAVIPLHSSS